MTGLDSLAQQGAPAAPADAQRWIGPNPVPGGPFAGGFGNLRIQHGQCWSGWRGRSMRNWR